MVHNVTTREEIILITRFKCDSIKMLFSCVIIYESSKLVQVKVCNPFHWRAFKRASHYDRSPFITVPNSPTVDQQSQLNLINFKILDNQIINIWTVMIDKSYCLYHYCPNI